MIEAHRNLLLMTLELVRELMMTCHDPLHAEQEAFLLEELRYLDRNLEP